MKEKTEKKRRLIERVSLCRRCMTAEVVSLQDRIIDADTECVGHEWKKLMQRTKKLQTSSMCRQNIQNMVYEYGNTTHHRERNGREHHRS